MEPDLSDDALREFLESSEGYATDEAGLAMYEEAACFLAPALAREVLRLREALKGPTHDPA